MLKEENVLHKGKWLQLSSISIPSDNNDPSYYECIQRIHKTKISFENNGVEAIGIIHTENPNNKKLILIANFRPLLGKYILEFPAGLSEEDGGRHDAERELKEETGYTPELDLLVELPEVTVFYNPKFANDGTKFYAFKVKPEKNIDTVQDLEAEENIKVILIDLDENLALNIKKIAEENDYLILNEVWTFAKGYVLRRLIGGKTQLN